MTSQVWNTTSGLPQDTVRQILQTQDGFLWMATDGGLVRSDSTGFSIFDRRNTPQMRSDLVNALFEDQQAQLWIGTSDGLLLRTHNAFIRYTMREGLPSSTIYAIHQDALGRIWVATAAGLARFEQQSFHPYSADLVLTQTAASPMLRSGDGSLWILTANAALHTNPSGQTRRFALPSSFQPIAFCTDAENSLWIAAAHALLHITSAGAILPQSPPSAAANTSLAFDRDSTLWVGTLNGLHAWNGRAWRSFHEVDGLPSEHIFNLQSGPHGALWIATGKSLSTYAAGHFSNPFEQEGFYGRELLALYQDHEANLWLGSENAGAAILRHPLFTTLASREGLPSNSIRSVISGTSADLWLGTSAGLCHLSDGACTNRTADSGLASDEILSLASSAQQHRLWIGTPDGLNSLAANGSIETLTASDGLPDNNIRSLLLSRRNDLWIGTTHGLALLPGSDPAAIHNLRTYTTADGLGSNVIGSILEDQDGSLWIGTLEGLSHLEPGGIHTYSGRDGLTTPAITALHKDAAGNLWIGTNGGGLFVFRDGKIHSLTSSNSATADRLPATIYSLMEDDTSHLWLGSSTGIYRVALSDLHSLLPPHTSQLPIAIQRFDVADGLRIQDCLSGGHPEATLAAGHQLWFATGKGASSVDTHNPALDLPAPLVHLIGVTIDDAPVPEPSPSSLHVAAGHPRLAFRYAGISFAFPSKVRYRYRLDRFDPNWIDAGTRQTAYYTNLPPGRYSFHVLASTDGGHWSGSAATLDLTIAPHLYQTWWFYTLVALALASFAWLLYLYRLRQVELRFQAVLAERGRIAREIHDTLAQDIVGISVQLELVSRLLSLSTDKARDQLQQTRELVRKSLANARSSIWDLRSPSATGLDLPTRLRSSTKSIPRSPDTRLQVEITGTYRPFPSETEEELLRIAQEATTNAARHAAAQNIDLRLIYHATGVRLEVHDDGQGFLMSDPKSGPPGHFGIRGMHERAERARATLRIQSKPGSGTVIVAEVLNP